MNKPENCTCTFEECATTIDGDTLYWRIPLPPPAPLCDVHPWRTVLDKNEAGEPVARLQMRMTPFRGVIGYGT